MRVKQITIVLILFAIVLLGGWDIYVASNAASGDTISEIILSASLRRPIIPFAAGVICGHLFWPQGDKT